MAARWCFSWGLWWAKVMNFVSKTRNCVSKTMNFASKTRNMYQKWWMFADLSRDHPFEFVDHNHRWELRKHQAERAGRREIPSFFAWDSSFLVCSGLNSALLLYEFHHFRMKSIIFGLFRTEFGSILWRRSRCSSWGRKVNFAKLIKFCVNDWWILHLKLMHFVSIIDKFCINDDFAKWSSRKRSATRSGGRKPRTKVRFYTSNDGFYTHKMMDFVLKLMDGWTNTMHKDGKKYCYYLDHFRLKLMNSVFKMMYFVF